jgi:putative SOS response-associated peptidase YedK
MIEEYFGTVSGDDEWNPRYNIAPTQPVPIIRQNPKEPRRELSLVRWGLIPSWAKDMSGAAMMINARSETAATKPAFRDPLTSRRCLVPADGFYEWQRRGKTKQPFCFEVNEGELFAFAGLWDRWKDPSGQWVRSCSILTTTPNAVTSAVHDRMPVILDPDNYDLWLDPGMTNVEAVSEMLKPYDARQMTCYPVNTRINYAANDDAECSAPPPQKGTCQEEHHTDVVVLLSASTSCPLSFQCRFEVNGSLVAGEKLSRRIVTDGARCCSISALLVAFSVTAVEPAAIPFHS